MIVSLQLHNNEFYHMWTITKKNTLDYKENYASTRSLETLFKLKEKTLLKSTKKVGRLNEIQPYAIEKTEIIYCLKPISIICMLFEK